MPKISKLWVQSFLYSILASHVPMLGLVMSNMAQPIMKILNKTSVEYLGIYDEGATLTSAMMFGDAVLSFFTIIFVLPLLDSMGRKFVCVKFKFALSFTIGSLLIAAYFLQSSLCLMFAGTLSGVNLTVKAVADSLYFAELWENNGYFTVAVLTISNVVAGPTTMFLSQPGILGNDSHWYLAPALGLIISVCFLLVGLTMDDVDVEIKKEKKSASSCNVVSERWSLLRQVFSEDGYRNACWLVIIVPQLWVWSTIGIETLYPIQLYRREGMAVDEVLSMNLLVYVLLLPLSWVAPVIFDRVAHLNILRLAAGITVLKGIVHIVGMSIQLKELAYVNSIFHQMFSSLGFHGFTLLICSESIPVQYRVVVSQVGFLTSCIVDDFLSTLFPLVADSAVILFAFIIVVDLTILIFIEKLYRNIRKVSHEERTKLLA